ncbi:MULTISPECIES: energy transducer TonB [unclassified Chelatococcus]|uniref:energy transducer TonB family protein n=1 Tax=unclassified Chelatococcus TaxID=2638111 RepID=UPI001BD06ED2|nr:MULTISPECIES: energy transducer TonB [unclassified Chelatococcus]MBS7695988.1 energy transducer TonB [Chelatococcus sp. YT9]MBX3555637.1 energy transducer TonB [Chelatococcus sp.]
MASFMASKLFLSGLCALALLSFVAPAAARDSAPSDETKAYVKHTVEILRARIFYPVVPDKPLAGGTAIVTFRIQSDGSVADVKLKRSSGHGHIDSTALGIVYGAQFAPPPAGVAGQMIVLPLAFEAPRPRKTSTPRQQ